MPNPAILWLALGTAVVGGRLIRREMRRVARKLEAEREARAAKLERVPLERDPATGIYRARKPPQSKGGNARTS